MLIYAVPKSRLKLISSTVKKRFFIISGLLLLFAMDSMALSLGRHRGVAIIGRPLDVTVQATLDAQDDPANVCLEADVFFADRRLGGSEVRVTSEKASSGLRDFLIRVRASALIDEPVVMIYLRAGCQQKTERRYVMLADLVSETETPLLSAPIAGVTARPLFVSPSLPANTGSSSANASALADPSSAKPSTARSTRRPRGVASAPAVLPGSGGDSAVAVAREATPAISTRPQRVKPPKAEDNNRARLKLEPFDLTIDRDPELKSSRELLSVPAATKEERQVAAALWRALTAQPQDILRDSEKLQSLENSVRSLQIQSQKNQLALTELNVQVQQARSERYANLLVYALCALLLAAIALVAYLWRQRDLARTAGDNELPWWRKNKPSEKGWADSGQDGSFSILPGASALQARGGKSNKNSPDASIDLDLDLDLGAAESGFTQDKDRSGQGQSNSISPLSPRDRSDFAMSMTHMARAVKAEELFDVQQQADFFVSLGQHEQAIEVLRNHISDNTQTSALVYLDLVNLYHQLNRKADYEALREDFNQLFNAKIPPFELYSDTSPGLEAYQVALSRIEALWPSPKVLDIIEDSIFRKPDTDSEAFDLGAYRELLLLYAVAKEIISPEGSGSGSLFKFDLPPSEYEDVNLKTAKFVATSIQPLSATVVAQEARQAPELDPLPVLPRPSPRLGLDLDLNDLFDQGNSPADEPESDSSFFEQFAENPKKDRSKPAAPIPVNKAPVTDNLMDFESFDSVMESVARKSPKV